MFDQRLSCKEASTSVTPDGLTAVNPAELLEILRGFPLLEAFHLQLCSRLNGAAAVALRPCGKMAETADCGNLCPPLLEENLQAADSTNQPSVFSCPGGLLNFIIPIDLQPPFPAAIIAGGVREKPPEKPSAKLSPINSVEQKPKENSPDLPCMSRSEVEAIAGETYLVLPSLLNRDLPALSLEKMTRRVRAVAEIGREIDLARGVEDLVRQIAETAVILFDAPRVAIVLSDSTGKNFYLHGGLGLPPEMGGNFGDFSQFLRQNPTAGPIAYEEVVNFFPGLEEQATHLPLVSGKQVTGAVILFGAELSPRDLLVLELFGAKIASRLLALRREEEFSRENSVSQRLLTMLNALARVETREELYVQTVEMAVDLLQSSSGSLMLLDHSGENLTIEAAKGMSLPLARSMNVRLGTGISGKVAKSGLPLLVNDIEKDSRVGIANRPRFRTKSFISVPLKPKETVIGVLNVADKEDNGIFTEADLNLLTAFAGHAGIMAERIAALEKTTRLEELAVTDPLTGLYNRRFLEKRLEEELSRSCRQNLSFTLVLVDLDNFKMYNDLCGHMAGDHALRRVARLLKGSAREMDVVTRYGGEEFCLVLPGTSKKESMFVAERVRRAIEKEAFPQEGRLPSKHLTASLGIASYPEDGSTASALIHAADIALYQAKKDGRNRLAIYTDQMPTMKETPDLLKGRAGN